MNKRRISKSKCIAKQGRYVHMKKLYVFGCTPRFIDYDGETNDTHVSLPSSMDNFHPIFFNCPHRRPKPWSLSKCDSDLPTIRRRLYNRQLGKVLRNDTIVAFYIGIVGS